MRRQRYPEVPRWRRSRYQPYQPVVLRGRAARKYAERTAQPAIAQPGVPGHPQVVGSHLQRATCGFRFRKHLVPFAWLAWMLAAGSAARLTPHPLAAGLALGVISGLPAVLVSTFPKVAALFTAALVPLLAAMGTQPPAPAVLVACWLAVTVPWLHRHRWRPGTPALPAMDDDVTRWNALAAAKKWNGHLGTPEALPGAGRRYPIRLDGIRTTISNVTAASENIAGAWHMPVTAAFAERSPDGVTSRGYLTILGRDTLMTVREWDGSGIDPRNGTAVIGRYADGSPARVKFLTPRYGTRHALLSGTTGSGKSALLDLLIFIALSSPIPIVPVILDPQEGQSLPYWRDKVLYASGRPECFTMLRGLHAGMMDRSRYLAVRTWDDEGVRMRGMGFYDHALTGLPVVLVIFDEAHMVLTGTGPEVKAAVADTMEISRLGRKTGVGLWLDTHLPSLSDLGGAQALRDMLRGGNVVGLRAANTVTAAMLGLRKDPGLIPMYFADGSETSGLCYLDGPDNRPDAPMRSDLVPASVRRDPPAVPALDDRFAAAMARAMAAGGVTPDTPGHNASPVAAVSSPDDDAPEGRTASDAVLAVLTEQMDRGRVIKEAGELAVTQWGRARPFSVKSISSALRSLVGEHRIGQVRHGVYAPVRAAQ